ncbi:MAG: hypothetical protein AAF542_04210 [Pseudomonadota bacterium]
MKSQEENKLKSERRFSEAFNAYASLGLLKAEFDQFPYALRGLGFDNLGGNEFALAFRTPNAEPYSGSRFLSEDSVCNVWSIGGFDK